MKPSNGSKTEIIPERSEEYLVSAAGFEPATHALKGSPTQLQTTTCTSSLLHARHNKINEMPTRHRSGCPEGARNPASRTMSLRFAGSFATRRNHFAEPSSIRLFSDLIQPEPTATYRFARLPNTCKYVQCGAILGWDHGLELLVTILFARRV